MELTRIALTAPLALSLAAPLAAQCSAGPFVGAPFDLSVADEPGASLNASYAYQKAAGFQTTAPGSWAPITGVPDFRLRVIFRSCGAAPTAFPDVDAMSLGEDWILADDATGRVSVPGVNWGGLTFSVTRGTNGRAGSVIRDSTLTPEGAAGDVFSYVLPGSAMPQPLVGRTERVNGGREIDLGPGAHDVDALDQFIPIEALDPPLQASMLPTPDWYFSFSNASLSNVPATWWGGTTPSGATIFLAHFSAATGQWTCPRIWKSYAQLGLTAADDVDALAVDVRNQRVLLSTTSHTRNPILFAFFGNDTLTLLPYEDVDTIPISDKIGLIGDDDIDAICAMDPSVRVTTTGGLNAFWYAMGTPVPKAYPFPASDVSASAFRTYDASGAGVRTIVSGWTPSGPAAGFAVLFLSSPTAPGTWLPGPILMRNPGDLVCGNPLAADLHIPASLALSADAVDLRWFVADQAITEIAEAYPLRVRL